jgi:tripartite-type tricarboxylate transporter receptor subunit TctC
MNMKPCRRQLLRRAAGGAAVAIVAMSLITVVGHQAWAQAARAIRIVVPFPAGGAADILARLLAEEIGRAHGPAMVIENKPGAGTVIGTELVARAAPDGQTLLMAANSFVINPHLRTLNYDPLTSFEPICYLARSPTVLVVNRASPYRTLAELLDAARAKPGELTIASVGPATSFHIAIEVLKRLANVNMTYVAYPGDPPAINALLGGHVTSVFANYGQVAEQIKAGKLRALATGSPTRIESLPEVQSIAEAGYKDYEVETWFAVLAPAKTPQTALSNLAAQYSAAVPAPEVKAKLAVQGLFPVSMCGADFAAFLRKQYGDYGRAIREANIKAD